jgi:acyl-coenzyme A thioesterase PaaI-like protein
LGTCVEARGRVRHAGRSTAVAEADLTGVEDGRLYATGSTTCMIMQG